MKSKNTLLIIMGLLIVAGLLVTGCTQPAAEIANPASVNCGKIGGTVDIKTNADGGQYGMCNFPNGTSCEEWTLFHNEGCNNGTAVTTPAPVNAGMAHPASANCGKMGGKIENRNDTQGNEYGMCMFTNGTTCDEGALFHNEGCKPFVAPNATPAK